MKGEAEDRGKKNEECEREKRGPSYSTKKRWGSLARLTGLPDQENREGWRSLQYRAPNQPCKPSTNYIISCLCMDRTASISRSKHPADVWRRQRGPGWSARVPKLPCLRLKSLTSTLTRSTVFISYRMAGSHFFYATRLANYCIYADSRCLHFFGNSRWAAAFAEELLSEDDYEDLPSAQPIPLPILPSSQPKDLSPVPAIARIRLSLRLIATARILTSIGYIARNPTIPKKRTVIRHIFDTPARKGSYSLDTQ